MSELSPITITCDVFASNRRSSLPGANQLSYRWLDGDAPDSPLLPILPPAVEPNDELRFVLIADPSQVSDPNARRDDLARVEVGAAVRLEMVPPDPDDVPKGWYSPIQPTCPEGEWQGDRYVFEPCRVVAGDDPGFEFRITVTVTDDAGEKVYSVDPEVYVGTGGGG